MEFSKILAEVAQGISTHFVKEKETPQKECYCNILECEPLTPIITTCGVSQLFLIKLPVIFKLFTPLSGCSCIV